MSLSKFFLFVALVWFPIIVTSQRIGPSMIKNLAGIEAIYPTTITNWTYSNAVTVSAINNRVSTRLRGKSIPITGNVVEYRGFETYLGVLISADPGSISIYTVELFIAGILNDDFKILLYSNATYGYINGGRYDLAKAILDGVDILVDQFADDWHTYN